MPLIVKGKQVVRKNQEQKVSSSPAPARPKKNSFQKERPKDINNDYRFDKNKTYLVVGGKVKEISSKSKYLLDMLIIEEEN